MTSRRPNDEPIKGYRLIEPLGSGGFGEVWKCEAPGGLFKAIKFVYGNLNSLDVDAARAEQELEALQRIKEVRHPFVLSLDRIEIVEGEVVIVMELADRSLHDECVDYQASGMVGIPRDALLRFVRDAAEALDHMHEKHALQHLDVKPRNLFLISDRVKVADFGLVKHLERQTSTGLMGAVTPLYASPETFSGSISEHSDQYSLAIVYQELLTGQRPFNGKNVRQLAQQHMQEEPELRSLPEPERPVVARALAKDPTKRFPTCLAFVRALYTAQGRTRPEIVLPDSANGTERNGHARRPKSLSETCEDIQLEDLVVDGPEEASGTSGELEEIEPLGITMAQPQSGALRPTVVIGVGSFGRKALRELRCRFLDRMGDLNKIPLLRFLYVDPDPEAIQDAVRGTPEMALSRNEVYHLPVQPVGHYRKRRLEHITEWMPLEKLYSIPRSLQTQGSRALGRLAFVDNHHRFLARLKREVQQVTHPDKIYQAVSQTGLALRDAVPRVYVIAGAGGGSSGFLVDLGFAVRRLMHQLRHGEAEVHLLLYTGAPSDPATPKGELANVYATLTELNHYSDPSIPFAAQYGADGPRVVEQGDAFNSTYLLQLAHRSPEALRDVVAHLGSYLFHELTTPLGLRLDKLRHQPAESPAFRSFGTYSIWFPRGLLLRLAARQACRQLIEGWEADEEPSTAPEVEAACARVLADPEFRPEAMGIRIEEATAATFGGTPAETLTKLLAMLEEQSQQGVAQEDPGNWARQALTRVQEWVGSSDGEAKVSDPVLNLTCGDWRKSHLYRGLTVAAEKLAQEWDQKLAQVAFGLMQNPGRRVAAAEVALKRFIKYCQECGAGYRGRREEQMQRAEQAWKQLEGALQGCAEDSGGGGWGLSLLVFGNRTRRVVRVFMDHLAAFARQCLAEEILAAGQRFFAFLQTRLDERLRELTLCRQRLRHLRQNLEAALEDVSDTVQGHFANGKTPGRSPAPSAESFWESIRHSATVRVVLPEGQTDLEKAATRFAATLSAELRTQLDQALQDRVLEPLGGLHKACAGSGDLVRTLAMPLLDQASAFLSEHLPVTDVAHVELTSGGDDDDDVAVHVQEYLARATPLLGPRDGTGQAAFLLVPASDAGKAFGERLHALLPELHVVRVPGQAHLMFCREQGPLDPDDLQRLFANCRRAYEDVVHVPQASPHARFDIVDWVPLDPTPV